MTLTTEGKVRRVHHVWAPVVGAKRTVRGARGSRHRSGGRRGAPVNYRKTNGAKRQYKINMGQVRIGEEDDRRWHLLSSDISSVFSQWLTPLNSFM